MKRTCFFFFFSLFSIHLSLGQNTYSSPYSVYGLGLVNERTSILNRALGGTGIAIQDELNLNHTNPASYGSIVSPISHVFEAGFYVESNRYQTNSLTESKSNGGLTNLSYWFKFSPWWSASAGISPFTNVSYDIVTTKQFSTSTDATYRYEGNGNITQLYLGNAFNVVKNLSLGINVSYLFGPITKSESIDSDASTSILTYENKIFTNKLDIDFGIQYRIKLKNRFLILGATADDGLTLKGKQTYTLYDSNSDTLSTSDGEKLTYKLPASVGFGVSLQSRRSIIASDIKFKKWTSAEFGDQDVTFQDTWRYSLGYAYKGNPEAESYLGLATLRAGFYVQNYHLTLKGNTLPNWGFSAGVGLPVFDNKSAINLTYAFDRLGTTNDGLVLQRSQKIMVEVVIRDLWGIKRKFD